MALSKVVSPLAFGAVLLGSVIPYAAQAAPYKWEDGSFERTEAKNRAALKAKFKKSDELEMEANDYFADPDWQQVISPDGVKCFVRAETAPRGKMTMQLRKISGEKHVPAR